MRHLSPLRALGTGFLAGVVGSGVQSIFFRLTHGMRPESPRGAFIPQDPRQRNEAPTQTIARRFYEDFMQAGSLAPRAYGRSAAFVHYAYGGCWGGLYGAVRESLPRGMGPIASTLGYGTLVWLLSDNALLYAFRLAGPPKAYPPKVHAYGWLAHVVYGAGLYGAYDALRARPLATGIALLMAQPAISRNVPLALRPASKGIFRRATRVGRLRDFVGTMASA